MLDRLFDQIFQNLIWTFSFLKCLLDYYIVVLLVSSS